MTVRHLILRFLPATLGIACTTLTTVRDPGQYVPAHNPERVWLMASGDTSLVVVDRPSIERDTLVGIVDGKYRRFPLSDLRTVEARTVSPSRTGLLVASAVAVPVAVISYFNSKSESSGCPAPACPYQPQPPGCVIFWYCA